MHYLFMVYLSQQSVPVEYLATGYFVAPLVAVASIGRCPLSFVDVLVIERQMNHSVSDCSLHSASQFRFSLWHTEQLLARDFADLSWHEDRCVSDSHAYIETEI
ncbi:TPA: hypothetical protein ACH3X1_006391 [Trebouxia sp. C0004]